MTSSAAALGREADPGGGAAAAERTIVVTGASTGIGHALVARLAAEGWHVVATVRRAEDATALGAQFGSAVTALIADAGPMGVPTRPTGRGLYVEQIDSSMLDAVLRLARLLDAPKDIAMLAPLIRREILYRLLRSPQGHRLYEIAIANSQSHRISQAIKWLNGNFEQPLRIDDLAKEVNLSVSTLHHRFKAMTAMSPLQYQKQLRLQEARRLMLAEGLEASAAGYRVGYESPSQFSREYSRLFGAPPLRDLARLRLSV